MTQVTNPEQVDILKPFFVTRSEWYNQIVSTGGGDITSVTAGAGLTGGGTSGDVTLDVVAATNSGLIVNADNITIDLDSPSGLALGVGGLSVADSLAGDGLSITSKVMAIDLASPSGLSFATGQLQIDDSIAGAGLSITGKVLSVTGGGDLSGSTGDGLVWDAINTEIDLGTPSSLSSSTTNSVTASSHTHEVTASSNPGAAVSLLETNASGYLQLVRLGAGVAPVVPLQARLGSFPQLRLEYDGTNRADFNVQADGDLEILPTTDLILSPGGNEVVINADVGINVIAPAYPLQVRSTTGPQVRVEYDASNWGALSTNVAGSMTVTASNNITFTPTGSVLFIPTSGLSQVTGQLGIGVSPNVALRIRDTAGPQVRVEYDVSNYGGLNTNVAGSMAIEATGNVILNPTGDVLMTPTGGDVQITGELGVGVSPGYPFHVRDIGGGAQLRLEYDATKYLEVEVATGGSSHIRTSHDVWLTPTGNVGINPTGANTTVYGELGVNATPTYPLQVRSTSNPQFRLEYDASNRIDFGVDSVGNAYFTPSGGKVYLSGNLGVGTGSPASYPIHIRQPSTPQIRIEYDISNFGTLAIDSGGSLTVHASGDWIFSATGNDVYPFSNYDLNLGLINKKWLQLHAAELWVETLVAQDTIATIGGRILVGPTTKLTSDLAAASTTIIVEHNQMTLGDVVYMEANGFVEFMIINSGPSAGPPYTYTVIRAIDPTSANDWYAGDAVFNTGQVDDGFIDLYSFSGVTSGTTGPTIVGNVRNPEGAQELTNGDFETIGAEELTNGDFETIGSEELGNPGFETAGAGGADIWATWTENAGSGTLANETTIVNSGADAAKMTGGATPNDTYVYQDITVVGGQVYKHSFWTRGDGTNAGQYQVRDVTGAADIIARTSTGVTGTAYTQVTVYFTVPASSVTVRIYLYSPSANGGIAYFDDISTVEVVTTNWATAIEDGSIDEELSLVHAGTYALKMTAGATVITRIAQDVTVVAGEVYRYSFWTRGDGTYAGQYRVYDLTNAADIIAVTSTGVTGTTYTQVTVHFTVPSTCVSVRIYVYCPSTSGGIAYFDDVSIQEAVTTNWVLGLNDGNIQAETSAIHGGTYALKLTAGATAGTHVRQNISGVSAGEIYRLRMWVRGDGTNAPEYRVYDVTGAANIIARVSTGVTGTSYTEVSVNFEVPASSTQVRLYLYSPATSTGVGYFDDVTMVEVVYNDWSEHWAIGNLNGMYGYATNAYGVGLGDVDKDYITIDPVNGIRFYSKPAVGNPDLRAQLTGAAWVIGKTTSQHVTIDASGVSLKDASSNTVIQLDTSGNAVLGVVATNQGNVLWNATNKRLEFRGGASGTSVEAYVDTDGSIVAGAGAVTLDSGGITIDDGDVGTTKITWNDGAEDVGTITTDSPGTLSTMYIRALSGSGDAVVNIDANSTLDLIVYNSAASDDYISFEFSSLQRYVFKNATCSISPTTDISLGADVKLTGTSSIIQSTAIFGQWRRETDYTLTTATPQTVTWENEDEDVDGMWTSGSNITPVRDGKYLVIGSADFTQNANGRREVLLYLEGSEVEGVRVSPVESGIATHIQCSTVMDVEVGVNDDISMVVRATFSSGSVSCEHMKIQVIRLP